MQRVKKNVLIIGHFALKTNQNDGQTVKTREIYNELLKNSENNIDIIDTHNWKNGKFKILKNILDNIKRYEKIIIIVSSGGAAALIPLLCFFKKLYKYRVCYCVVGCWLDYRIKKNVFLRYCVKHLDLVLVETAGLKKTLNNKKIYNVDIMYNFKNLTILNVSNKNRKRNTFCTFSRVIKDKGIADAMYAIDSLNKEGMNLELDIYGPISDEYRNEFNDLLLKYNQGIKYKGNISPDKSIEYISNYDLLLFPTHYIKEGLPGTIIDAYCSATPVIASNWMYANEFITNKTGYRYQFSDREELKNTIKNVLDDRKDIERKRKECIKFVDKFIPLNAIKPLLKFIDK